MNRVAIVVLNWNGADDTLQCVNSLLKQDYSKFHIVIVDNGSADDSPERLEDYRRKHANEITILYNKKNEGFAGGVNTGIRWAIDNSFDVIALFNNDATANPSWLSKLVAVFDNTSVGIATGLLLRENGSTIDSTGEQYSKWGLPFPRSRNEPTELAPIGGLTFGATGGASLYRVSLFLDIGLFDEDFFAYYEDVDVSFRAQLAGWKVAYTPKAVAYHKQGATSSKIPGFTIYQAFKNLPLLLTKDVPLGLLFPIGVRFLLAYILMFWKAVFHGNGWYAFKGFLVHFIYIPKELVERRHVQSHKKVSTEYIRSLLWDDLPPEQTGLRKVRRLFIGK